MPVAQPNSLRWHLAIVGLLISISPLPVASSGDWIVPEDRSLSVSEYQDLGVPSPEKVWSGSDHKVAAELLTALDPRHLPRQGSHRSGTIFRRLVESQEAWAESIWMNARLGDDTFEIARSTPSVTALYERPLEAGLFFDRELVEIYAQTTRSLIEASERTHETSAALARAASRELTEREAELVDEMLRHDRQEIEDSHAVALISLSKLVSVGEVSATRQTTRIALRDRLEELVPRMARLLPDVGVSALDVSLRALAERNDNSLIRSDLIALADAIAEAAPVIGDREPGGDREGPVAHEPPDEPD